MGHQIGYLEMSKDSTLEDVLERLDFAYDPQETDSYHGNMTLHKKIVYENREEARKAIEHFDTGWYSDHAVLFKNKEFNNNKVVVEKIRTIRTKKAEYLEKNSVKNFKSNLIGCKVCGSKLRREYLKGNECPLCGKSLLSETTLNRLKSFDKKVEEVKEKNSVEKVRMLVKYEYHC